MLVLLQYFFSVPAGAVQTNLKNFKLVYYSFERSGYTSDRQKFVQSPTISHHLEVNHHFFKGQKICQSEQHFEDFAVQFSPFSLQICKPKIYNEWQEPLHICVQIGHLWIGLPLTKSFILKSGTLFSSSASIKSSTALV